MKPLKLTLEGLQSYREEQTIDFSLMNGCGLFGIFGPTGSGKSTILDAMTLALFGRVTRASFKTQGIINSTVDKASVSMSFELSLEGERRTYLVERTYRRRKQAPDSCEARVCRLIRLDAGGMGGQGQVLADKAGDVDEAVEKLLGLGFDDFTRAVVLPQNQFQEFLLLGKKEKSDMLERLFCLEEYGRELIRKIAAGRRRADEEIAMAAGALKVLEDCTDDAVAALKEEAAASGSALREAAIRSEAAQRDLAANREIHQFTVQKRLLLARQDRLSTRSQAVAGSRVRLAAARAAEPIWPVWLENSSLLMESGESARKLAAIESEAAGLDRRLAESRQMLLADQSGVAARRTAQDLRIRQLDQAAALADQLSNVKSRRVTFENDRQALHKAIASASTASTALLSQAEAFEQSLLALRGQRQRLLVDPAWRRDLEKWLETSHKSSQLHSSLIEARQRETELAALLRQLTEQNQQAGQSVTNEEASVILNLAEQLQTGQPCPVCGACDHPHPARADDHRARLISGTERDRLRREHIQAEERLNACRQLIDSLQLQISGSTAESAALLIRLPQLDELDDPAYELEKLHSQETELAAIDKQLPELELSARQARENFQRERALHDQLAGQLTGSETLGDELAAQYNRLTSDLAAMLPDFLPEQQTPEFIQQTLAELRLSIRQAEQRSESLQADLRALESQRQTLELRRIETQTQLSMLMERSRQTAANLSVMLAGAGFADGESLAAARLEPEALTGLARDIADYDTEARDIELQLRVCEDSLQGRWLDDESWGRAEAEAKTAEEMLSQARLNDDRTQHKLADMLKSQAVRQQKEMEHAAAAARRGRISQIEALVRGNAFVEYVAEERLRAIVAEATEYLQTMTRYRYALELDTERSFVVRDQLNGGEVRLAGSLSGGETFMASLALALALSSQIQIRGQSRLEFFFLDEGFGSLDNDLLDTVMDSLERISSPQRLIGLISHVPELRNRIGTRLVIEPAGTRSGSKISLEHG